MYRLFNGQGRSDNNNGNINRTVEETCQLTLPL